MSRVGRPSCLYHLDCCLAESAQSGKCGRSCHRYNQSQRPFHTNLIPMPTYASRRVARQPAPSVSIGSVGSVLQAQDHLSRQLRATISCRGRTQCIDRQKCRADTPEAAEEERQHGPMHHVFEWIHVSVTSSTLPTSYMRLYISFTSGIVFPT